MVQDLRHPADTNWAVRLDLVYNIKSRSHPRKLTEEQQLDKQDEPRIHKPDTADLTPGPSCHLYQRTGDRNLQSYRKISSKVKSTCNHKIILNNGVLLRKFAITVSRKPAKKVPASFPQTPTLKAIKQKELAIKKTKTDTVKSMPRTLKKSTASRLFQKICESESENDSENVPLSISKKGSNRRTIVPESKVEPHATVEQSVPVEQSTMQTDLQPYKLQRI